MKERPILFQGAMVRAILAGNKSQTRRLVKAPSCHEIDGDVQPRAVVLCRGRRRPDGSTDDVILRCPYGVPGDRLWVKETLRGGTESLVRYDADNTILPAHPDGDDYIFRWRRPCDQRWPAIHMPRWASRITLEVTAVRAERLQRISEHDAIQEGVAAWVRDPRCETARDGFGVVWDSINGTRAPWVSNPWVWVVEFKCLITKEAS